MKQLLYIITLLIIIVTFNSCVAYKADSTSVSDPDYNQRVTVTGAHYDAVLTPIGVTSIAASTIGGGYLGYQSDLIRINNGTEQTTFKIGNAILGAAVGFGTSYALNRLFGWGKTEEYVDGKEWAAKANKNFLFLASPNTAIKLIPRNADQNYQIKNISDAREFKSVFNNSQNTDNVFKTGVENCNRSELPELINLYPSTPSLITAKDKFIVTSPTYSEIVNAVSRYPDVNKDYELNFLNLVAKSTDAIDFKGRYQNSTNFKRSYLNAFLTQSQTASDFIQLDKLYTKTISKLSLNEIGKESGIIVRNYFNSRYLVENPTTVNSVVNIFYKYNVLDYYDKKNDLISKVFNVADVSMTDGDEILWNLRQLSNKSMYPNLNIEPQTINDFINKKLNEEVDKNVRIISTSQVGSPNKQWEEWKNNETYTAGLVGSDDATYILYGVVQNNSKFNLPVEIVGSGNLISKASIQGNGNLSNILVGILNILSGGYLDQIATIDHGVKTSSFYIPNLPKKSKGEYAVRLDFHGAWITKGANLWDLAKGKVEPELKSTTVTKKFTSYVPSDYIIQKQFENQQFVKYGVPDNNLTDLWRGGEVNNDEWNEKWKIRQEEIRIANEYARTHPSYSSSDYSNNSSSDENQTHSCVIKEIKTNEGFWNAGGIKWIDDEDTKYYIIIFEDDSRKAIFYRPSKGEWFISDGWQPDAWKTAYDSKDEAIRELLKQCEEQ